MNYPRTHIHLMVIDFYVLIMDIGLGIVKFLTGTFIIRKTLEASSQDHEANTKQNLLWMILNASNVIIMHT